MKNNPTKLSMRIKELRHQKGLTQKQLATAINISYSSIIDYENGRREPNSKAMAALERFFGVSGDFLRGNLDTESFYKNSAQMQSSLDHSIDLMTAFKGQLGISSQTKQDIAVSHLNNTLTFIIEHILPDESSEFNVEMLNSLITKYIALNDLGKKELLKRADELTQLKSYNS